MLEQLYKYAVGHSLTARPGFKPKKPKAYILISADGAFIGIDCVDKDAPSVMAPDIGSTANGTRYCNPLIEKACIPLCIISDEKKDKNIQTKHAFFCKVLSDGSEAEPLFKTAETALTDEKFRTTATDALGKNKLKPGDAIGFKVDGMPLEESRNYLDWWGEYRKSISEKPPGKNGVGNPICLITGEEAPALETVPKVSGLRSVGGHTSGDAFLCFDKDAFQSFGLKQSLNAPVSEEAMAAVNAALTKLIANAGKPIGGAKLVHWYSSEVKEDDDPLPDLFGGVFADEEETEAPESEEDAQRNNAERERAAMRKATVISESIRTGERPELCNARYYIMPLSGAGGRMMVRGWQEGDFSVLCKNINAWFDDIRLISHSGNSMTKNPKFMVMMIRLLKPGDDRKVFDRINSELSNLSMRIINNIITGSPLPDEVVSKALCWLRSAMVSGGKDGEEKSGNSKFGNETIAYQWLKIWLLRRQRAKGEKILMGEKLNPDYPGIAYHCGRMMAIFAKIQKEALGDVGSSVVQRYFASACRAPMLVLGKLSTLCNYHLAKIDNPSYVANYNKMLADISEKIGTEPMPKMFTVAQQAEFSLGYYQQNAEMYRKKADSENE